MRTRGAALAAVASLTLLVGCSQGQGGGTTNADGEWQPDGNVEIAVGASPGGGSDILAREFAGSYETISGNSAAVENYDNVEGVLIVKREAGNGAIIGVGNRSNMVVRPNVQDAGYTWQDFTQLAVVAEDVSYIVAGAGAFESAEAMLDAAGTEDLTIGQVGSGAGDTLLTTQIGEAFDVTFQDVAFEGGGELIRAVVSGDVDLAVLEPAEFLPQVEAGELDVLLSTGTEAATHPALAEVPLARDLGAGDQTFTTQWRVIFGAPDLTDAQRTYWTGVIEEWTQSPSYDEYINQNALAPRFIAGQELTDFITESEADLREAINGG